MILHVRHVRAAGLCVWGLRAWCRANRVDLRRMCTEGVPLEERPELVDDPFVQRAVLAAEEEARGG